MMGMAVGGTRWSAVLRWVGVAGAVVAIGACGDDDNDIIVGPGNLTGVVFTLKDSSFNFGALRTFSMPDTVVHLVPLTGTEIPVPRDFDRAILDRVRADFLARGYVEVSPPLGPADFLVLVGATATQNYNAWVAAPFSNVWVFSPAVSLFLPNSNSWTIVYPWFGTVGVTAFDRGTLIVDLVPHAQVNPLAQTVQSAWAGVATAELAGQVTTSSINAAIDEMFRQSPYLTPVFVTPAGASQNSRPANRAGAAPASR